MENINKLSDQIKELLDAAQEKPQIEKISIISNTLNEAKKEIEALKTEQKELLNSYKELVKHTSFKPSDGKTEERTNEDKQLSFDEFLAQAMNK